MGGGKGVLAAANYKSNSCVTILKGTISFFQFFRQLSNFLLLLINQIAFSFQELESEMKQELVILQRMKDYNETLERQRAMAAAQRRKAEV